MAEDRIERETLIDAPPDVVWGVITKPEQIKRWFSPEAELELHEGGQAAFGFPEHDHTIRAQVVHVDEPRAFAWRWIHAEAPELGATNSTLVEFTLLEEGAGTRLKVVESGFTGVEWPPERDAAEVRAAHIEGWDRHLGQLDAVFGAPEGVAS
jgi:uncharacterized protein YndB with AHSA1/START domain